MKTPRGIRNNNPLNIRVGNNWKGEVSQPTDHTFEQFTEMKWGVRAAFIILRNYIQRHQLNTVRKIITRWAPSNENNTAKYIETVCQRAHIGPDEVINYENMINMVMLFEAMCIVENGRTIDMTDVIEGWKLANRR